MMSATTISHAAAEEVIKLIEEHLKEGGPFDNDLLLEVSDALTGSDRIEISDDED